MQVRELKCSCAPLWPVSHYILIFLSLTFISGSNFHFSACVEYNTRLSLCLLPNLMRFRSWLMLCYRGDLLQSIRLCSFWTRPYFVPMAIHNFTSCALWFRVICWTFITLPIIFFLSFHLSVPALCQFQWFLSCDRVWIPCNFIFLMWLSLLMLSPIIGPLIFRVLGFPPPVAAPSLVLCTRCILSHKTPRLLHSCFIKWLFSYPIRSLLYIWPIVLLKLNYVFKVVRLLFFFPD